MWRTSLLVVALLVGLSVADLYAGVAIGDAMCNDAPGEGIPDFRCLDDVVYGGAAGFATGLLMAVALTVAFVRRYRRKRRELELSGLT